MRQFKLINSLGAEYDLMRKDAFFNVPAGLGFSKNNTYSVLGESFLKTTDQSAQSVVTGEMVFKGYAQYEEFARFIAYKPLKMAYKPLNTWLYLNGEVTRLDKGEISYSTGRLHSAVDFTGVSKWYVPRVTQKTEADLNGAKVYPYAGKYVYREAKLGTINIDNNGTEESPCILTIVGPATNPFWKLSVNGKVVSEGKLNGTIKEGYMMVVDSNDANMRIAEYLVSDGSFVQNMFQSVDHNMDNFLYVPVGKSTLTVDSESSRAIVAYLEVDEVNDTL